MQDNQPLFERAKDIEMQESDLKEDMEKLEELEKEAQ